MIIKHHTSIYAIIHEANNRTNLEQYTLSTEAARCGSVFMVGRLARHGKGGGMGSVESELGGGGAESGWKMRGRLKTPLIDGARVAARQGGRSKEWRGYAGLACWAAVAATGPTC